MEPDQPEANAILQTETVALIEWLRLFHNQQRDMTWLSRMNMRPRVSIVVPNFNGKDLLKECLDSIRNLHYDNYEVIVVDNSSSDGSAEMVREQYPWARLLVTERIKMGPACNRGIRLAEGDVIVTMLNNDMTVDRYWLDHLIPPLMEKEVGIVGGKMYAYGTNRSTEALWIGRVRHILAPSYIFSLKRSSTPHHPRKNGEEQYSGSFEADDVDVPTLRRDVMNVIGGIDEEYEHSLLDWDYCIRAKKAGYKVVYVPAAVAWHRGAATVSTDPAKMHYAGAKDQMRFVIKYSGPLLILYCFFARIIFVLMKSFSDLFRRRGADMVRLHIKAVLWNLANLRQTLYSRRKLWL